MAGSNIGSWFTAAASNATVGSITWAEGQAPSTVNDSARQLMADVRTSYNDIAAGWFEYGDGSGTYTPTYNSATSFRIDGVDVSTIYTVGRRVRVVAATPGTIYGYISAVSFSTNTTVTVVFDSGSLSNEAITSVAIGLAVTNNPLPNMSALTLYTEDNGASAGPTITGRRLSSTPAGSDVLLTIDGIGRDTTPAYVTYGQVQFQIVDATTAAGDGAILLNTLQNNVVVTVAKVGATLQGAQAGFTLVDVALTGKHMIPVYAGQMVPRVTNGAARSVREQTTNDNMTDALAFDQTTQEFAQFEIEMPESWDEGTVTFIPVWTAASGTGGVVWALQGVAQSNDDAIDVAFGTEQTSTDTLIATNDRHKGPVSSAITIGGTPAAGDTVQFTIKRNVSDGSDTLTADAELLEIRLYMTLAAGNDA